MLIVFASGANAGSLPTEIGGCAETAVKEVTTRLGTPDSGTSSEGKFGRYDFVVA